jgi:hypothetical protein
VESNSLYKPDLTSGLEVAVAEDRWSEIRGLVESAMALDPGARLTYLTGHARNADIAEEAAQLLGFDREASNIFPVDGWKQRACPAPK